MKFRSSFVRSVMGSIAGHAVIGAAMMGLAATTDTSEPPPPKSDSDVATALPPSGELSDALKKAFFSSSGMSVDTSSHKFLHMGAQAPTLSGQVEFCKRLPDTCIRITNEYAPLRVDAAFLNKLAAENVFVNAAIAYMGDKEQYGEDEYWNFPDGAGDCEDYVLAKMKIFYEKFGVPLNNMSIVHVEVTPDEKDVGKHAVLALRTSDGDYLFDNRTNNVMFPYETSYKFVSATSFEKFTAWKDIGSVKYSLIADEKGNPRIDMFVRTSLTNVPVPAFKRQP